MKFSRKFIIVLVVLGIGFLIIAPVVVGTVVSMNILESWTNSNDWIGFWGSYLGAIIGGIITLMVLWKTIASNEKEKREREKREFLLSLIEEATYLDMYPKKILYPLLRNDDDLYHEEMLEYERRALALNLRIKVEKEKNAYKGVDELIKKLEDNLKAATDALEKGHDMKDKEEQMKFIQKCKLLGWTSDAIISEIRKFVIANQKG